MLQKRWGKASRFENCHAPHHHHESRGGRRDNIANWFEQWSMYKKLLVLLAALKLDNEPNRLLPKSVCCRPRRSASIGDPIFRSEAEDELQRDTRYRWKNMERNLEDLISEWHCEGYIIRKLPKRWPGSHALFCMPTPSKKGPLVQQLLLKCHPDVTLRMTQRLIFCGGQSDFSGQWHTERDLRINYAFSLMAGPLFVPEALNVLHLLIESSSGTVAELSSAALKDEPFVSLITTEDLISLLIYLLYNHANCVDKATDLAEKLLNVTTSRSTAGKMALYLGISKLATAGDFTRSKDRGRLLVAEKYLESAHYLLPNSICAAIYLALVRLQLADLLGRPKNLERTEEIMNKWTRSSSLVEVPWLDSALAAAEYAVILSSGTHPVAATLKAQIQMRRFSLVANIDTIPRQIDDTEWFDLWKSTVNVLHHTISSYTVWWSREQSIPEDIVPSSAILTLTIINILLSWRLAIEPKTDRSPHASVFSDCEMSKFQAVKNGKLASRLEYYDPAATLIELEILSWLATLFVESTGVCVLGHLPAYFPLTKIVAPDQKVPLIEGWVNGNSQRKVTNPFIQATNSNPSSTSKLTQTILSGDVNRNFASYSTIYGKITSSTCGLTLPPFGRVHGTMVPDILRGKDPYRNREERTGISCCSPHPLFSEDLVDLETLFYFALTVLRTIRRTSLAERVFQSYIDMKASSEWTIDSINSMLSAIFRTITGSVRSSIMEALNDLYSNRPKSAEELASRALSMDPDNLEAEIILTRALFSQTNREVECSIHLERILRLDPGNQLIRWMLINLRRAFGDEESVQEARTHSAIYAGGSDLGSGCTCTTIMVTTTNRTLTIEMPRSLTLSDMSHLPKFDSVEIQMSPGRIATLIAGEPWRPVPRPSITSVGGDFIEPQYITGKPKEEEVRRFEKKYPPGKYLRKMSSRSLQMGKAKASAPVAFSKFVGCHHVYGISDGLPLLEMYFARYQHRFNKLREERQLQKLEIEKQYEEERQLRISIANHQARIEALQEEIKLVGNQQEYEEIQKEAICAAYNRELHVLMKSLNKERKNMDYLFKQALDLQSKVVELPEDFFNRLKAVRHLESEASSSCSSHSTSSDDQTSTIQRPTYRSKSNLTQSNVEKISQARRTHSMPTEPKFTPRTQIIQAFTDVSLANPYDTLSVSSGEARFVREEESLYTKWKQEALSTKPSTKWTDYLVDKILEEDYYHAHTSTTDNSPALISPSRPRREVVIPQLRLSNMPPPTYHTERNCDEYCSSADEQSRSAFTGDPSSEKITRATTVTTAMFIQPTCDIEDQKKYAHKQLQSPTESPLRRYPRSQEVRSHTEFASEGKSLIRQAGSGGDSPQLSAAIPTDSTPRNLPASSEINITNSSEYNESVCSTEAVRGNKSLRCNQSPQKSCQLEAINNAPGSPAIKAKFSNIPQYPNTTVEGSRSTLARYVIPRINHDLAAVRRGFSNVEHNGTQTDAGKISPRTATTIAENARLKAKLVDLNDKAKNPRIMNFRAIRRLAIDSGVQTDHNPSKETVGCQTPPRFISELVKAEPVEKIKVVTQADYARQVHGFIKRYSDSSEKWSNDGKADQVGAAVHTVGRIVEQPRYPFIMPEDLLKSHFPIALDGSMNGSSYFTITKDLLRTPMADHEIFPSLRE